LYSLKFYDKSFSTTNLEVLVNDVNSGLEEGCKKLEGAEYSIVIYKVRIWKSNYKEKGKEIPEWFARMEGSFDLTAQGGRSHALPDFEYGYKKSLEKLRKEAEDIPLDAEIDLIAFRDSITHIVKLKTHFQKTPNL